LLGYFQINENPFGTFKFKIDLDLLNS